MKKIFLLSLVTVLAVGLVGCANNNDIQVDNNDNVVISGDNNIENNEDVNTGNNEEANDSTVDSEGNQDNVEDNNTVSENEGNSEVTTNPEDNNVENNEPEVSEPENKEPENNEPEVVEPDNNEENLPEEDITVEQPEDETNSEETTEPEEEVEEEIVMSELEIKINSLIEKSGVMIRMPMAMPIEASTAFTFIGLSEDEFNANVANAVSFESMIMPANQSVCLVELKDTADVKTIKQKMIDNCDPNKWICMSAEKCMVVESGNYVLLVMATPDDCDALQKTFAAEFGGAGEALTK